jgi:hypothetical protein
MTAGFQCTRGYSPDWRSSAELEPIFSPLNVSQLERYLLIASIAAGILINPSWVPDEVGRLPATGRDDFQQGVRRPLSCS